MSMRTAVAKPAPILLRIESELEDDGRWLADVLDLPGVMAYGESQEEAIAKVQALALRVLADKAYQLQRSTPENSVSSVSSVVKLS